MTGFVRLITPFFSLSSNAAYCHKTIETGDKTNDLNRKVEFSKDKKEKMFRTRLRGTPWICSSK